MVINHNFAVITTLRGLRTRAEGQGRDNPAGRPSGIFHPGRNPPNPGLYSAPRHFPGEARRLSGVTCVTFPLRQWAPIESLRPNRPISVRARSPNKQTRPSNQIQTLRQQSTLVFHFWLHLFFVSFFCKKFPVVKCVERGYFGRENGRIPQRILRRGGFGKPARISRKWRPRKLGKRGKQPRPVRRRLV